MFTSARDSRPHVNLNALSQIEHFEKAEFSLGIEQLKKNKAANRAGLIADMIKYGPDILHDHLLKVFNDVILKKEVVDGARLNPKQGKFAN